MTFDLGADINAHTPTEPSHDDRISGYPAVSSTQYNHQTYFAPTHYPYMITAKV